MADTEGNLFNYEGKSWGYFAEKLGFRSPTSDQDDEEPVKTNREASATRLKKDDMPIYGYCPRYDDFYLVVCNICNKAVKPQALKDHIVIRHNGSCSSVSVAKQEKQLKPKKSSTLHLAKILGRAKRRELISDDPESPADVPRNDFSHNDSLQFKPGLFNKDYDLKSMKDLSAICNNLPNSGTYLRIKEELNPLLKINPKAEYMDNVLPHENASLSYLTPPVPPDIYSQHNTSQSNITQHNMLPQVAVLGSVTANRRPSTPCISPHAQSSAIGQGPVGRPSTPGLGQPLTPGGMGPPTPGGMGPPTPGGLGPLTPGGLGPSTPGGLGPPTPGRGPPTPIMGPSPPGICPPIIESSTPVMVQQGSGLIHTISANIGGPQIIAPQSPNLMQQNTIVAVPSGSPYGTSMSPVATTLTYQSMPLVHTGAPSPLYSTVAANYPSSISTRHINVSGLQTISSHGLQTLNLHALPEILPNTSSQVEVLCQDRMDGMNISDHHTPVRNSHSCVMSTEEEEVNRISAMLMRETESMTIPQQVTAHDVVEAQGLAGGGIRRGPQVANNIYPNQVTFSVASTLPSSVVTYPHSGNIQLQLSQQSSTPVPMNSDSINMATIKQLRDKLLEAVSESDLNAVLNVTPDAPVIENNNQCFIRESHINNFSDNAMADQFLNISEISNQGNVTFKTVNDNSSNVEQITDELLEVGSYKMHEQQYSNSQLPMQTAVDLAARDELARAVGSITGISQESNNNYTMLTSLLQQPTIPSPLTVSIPHSNLDSVAKANSSEGITVVFESNPKNSNIAAMSTRCNSSIPVATMSGHTLNNMSNEPIRSNSMQSGPHSNINNRTYSENQFQSTPTSLKNVIQANLLTNEQYESLPNKRPQQSPQPTMSTMNQQTKYNCSSSYVVQQKTTNPIMTIPPPMESPKSKRRRTQARKNVPLKDRAYDPEVHCGVLENDRPCTRSLTCKSHSLSNRRAVLGRSKRFDELLYDHKSKGQLNKATKQADSSNFIQNTSPGAPIVIGSSSQAMSSASMMSGPSPIIVRALSATHLPEPSPTSQYFNVDAANSQVQNSACNTYRHQVTPVQQDDWYCKEPPKPISSCMYNSRKLGGFLATDHKADNLRSAFRNCLKKPIVSASNIDLNTTPSNPMTVNVIPERYNNVKPLLARKLQAAVPCSSVAKDCNVGVVYNGQLLSGAGVGQTLTIKRPTSEQPRTSILSNAKPKNKKARVNDGAINYVSNLVQIDATRSKTQYPMVAVSVQNGIATPHTITLGNMMTGMRNPTAQSIRIHPQLTMKDGKVDARTSLAEGTNIVLGSGMPSGGFVIADTLKPLKADQTIRIDSSKLIAAAPKGNLVVSTAGTGINLVGSTNSVVGNSSNTPVLAQNLGHQGQYFFTTVPGNPNSQLLQPLRTCRMGKASSVKLLGTNQATVSGARQPIVLQQDKEAS